MSIKSEETPQGILALAFAHTIVAGNYDQAHAMLAPSLQIEVSAAQLAETFQKMIDYGDAPPDNSPNFIGVLNVLDEWPARKVGDVGWAYVALSNDYYSEAISTIVAKEHGKPVIRELKWGRP